ncbi:MAG TPA: TadE/TadG family type IV pilus assembly protein [Bryobacteraceae bacterium]|nr:TadE/TadG family type IV pilus assembly protein [Bryobacteraceae bacterium]
MRNRISKRRGERGQAMVEIALLSPWIFFLFIGILDFGFYAYSAICTQNAARVAAIVSAEPSTIAVDPCKAALAELAMLPNVPTGGTCSGTVLVTVTNLTGPDGKNAVQSKVTYQSINLVPIPGILPNQITFVRTAEVRTISQ